MMSTSSITQKRQIKVVIGRQVNISYTYPKIQNWLLVKVTTYMIGLLSSQH